jgi:hypothetical protein
MIILTRKCTTPSPYLHDILGSCCYVAFVFKDTGRACLAGEALITIAGSRISERIAMHEMMPVNTLPHFPLRPTSAHTLSGFERSQILLPCITDETVDVRRTSSYFVPIAKPKKKGSRQLNFLSRRSGKSLHSGSSTGYGAKSECRGDPGHYRMAGGPILIMEGYYIR